MIESVLGDVEHQLRANHRSRLLGAVPNLLQSLAGIQRSSDAMQVLAVSLEFVR